MITSIILVIFDPPTTHSSDLTYPTFLAENILLLCIAIFGMIAVLREHFTFILGYLCVLSTILISSLIEFDGEDILAYLIVSIIMTVAVIYLFLLKKKLMLDRMNQLFSHYLQDDNQDNNDNSLRGSQRADEDEL